MQRLTEKDELGNWCLKGVKWEQLRAGQVLSKNVAEKLYGALFKLMAYENTKCSPRDVEGFIELSADLIKIVAEYVKKCRWIPVEERLPEEDKWVQVVVKRHRWISDFGDKSVPDEEKEDHSELKYCTLAKLKKDGTWAYLNLESDEEYLWTSITDDCSQEDLSYPLTEVLAWMPLPEPYKEEKQHE